MKTDMNTEIITPLEGEVPTGLIPASETDAGGQEAIILFDHAEAETSVSDDDPMTDGEWQRRDELETQIDGNWVQIVLAKKEMRESKLYRRTRDGEKQTWEEYCKRAWDQTRQYVDRSIRAVDVIETLKMETFVSVFPDSIVQAAPLAGLKPDEMAQATEAAFKSAESEKRNVKAKDFEKAAKGLRPPKQSKGKKKPPAAAQPNNRHRKKRKSMSEPAVWAYTSTP